MTGENSWVVGHGAMKKEVGAGNGIMM